MKKIHFLLLSMCVWFAASAWIPCYAGNVTKTVRDVSTNVTLTDDVDYVITSTTPFTTTGSVDIVNTEHAVVIIKSIKPSVVIKQWLSYVKINGAKAVNNSNCQVKMYGRGTIIFPYGSNFRPLTCYTEQNFEGEASTNYTEGHVNGFMKTLSGAQNNSIRSFKLKRGYMVTFAIGTAGWGYSRCFIADQEDLEVATLPVILDKRISSYRIFKWHNAHKAGLASDGRVEANQALNSSWCYDWAGGNESTMPDTEWVPNHIYEDWPSASSNGTREQSCHMKTNNEPGNSADDHPQSVETVIGNWPSLMRTGMRLCSETSHDGSWGHLEQFFHKIDSLGYRCDIVDLHCYWSGGFDGLETFGRNSNGRPIWISEWIWGASWNQNGAFSPGRTDDDTYNNTVNILTTLNNTGRVERYAYWNSESKAHIYESSLTKLGTYYSTMNVGLGYNSKYEFIPKNPPLKELGTPKCSYTSSTQMATITWTDTNHDLLNEFTIQCKYPESNNWTNVGAMAVRDQSSGSPASYSFKHEISDPGVYTYRIRAHAYNNRVFYSEENIVNVDPSQGNETIQYGKLLIDSPNEYTINFNTEFETNPCIFIGSWTNANPNYLAGNYTAKTMSTKSFTFQVQPWITNTGSLNKMEEIPFMALQSGNYTFGELQCEVGTYKSGRSTSGNKYSEPVEVEFKEPFPEGVIPVVLTEMRNPNSTKTTFCPRIYDVTNKGFKMKVYTEEAGTVSVALSKNMFYFAITPGVGVIDDENSIYIAAGHGTDNQIYSQFARSNNFYCVTEGQEGEPVNQQIYLYKPVILAQLQTNNYPALGMTRRTDITVTDDEGTWTKGINMKRVFDHNIVVDGKTIDNNSTSNSFAAYRDNMGWVAITGQIKGVDVPGTGIKTLEGNPELKPQLVDGRIVMDGDFSVYTLSGVQINAENPVSPGVYVVRAKGQSVKVMIK